MNKQAETILLIGYGNPGRLDDGLGPKLSEEINKLNLPDVTVDSNYQLTVEDAAAVAEHDIVIFADACVDSKDPFYFKKIIPKEDMSFTTHSITPENVLAISHNLFGAETKGYLLGIKGYKFNEFGSQLSEGAKNNLNLALEYLKDLMNIMRSYYH